MPMKKTSKRSSKKKLQLHDKHDFVGVVAETLEAVRIARIYVCVPTHLLFFFVHRCGHHSKPRALRDV